jgi:hypothetical protein
LRHCETNVAMQDTIKLSRKSCLFRTCGTCMAFTAFKAPCLFLGRLEKARLKTAIAAAATRILRNTGKLLVTPQPSCT